MNLLSLIGRDSELFSSDIRIQEDALRISGQIIGVNGNEIRLD